MGTPDFQFRDVLNYHSPIDLDGYLKSWTANAEKWPYPYNYFENIEQLKDQKTFPSFEQFQSDLKDVTIDFYNKGKSKFDYHRSLENDDKWENFLDYLRFYNIQDCKPLSIAMRNSFQLFKQTFNVEMSRQPSIAGFAQTALMKLYIGYIKCINLNILKIFYYPIYTIKMYQIFFRFQEVLKLIQNLMK